VRDNSDFESRSGCFPTLCCVISLGTVIFGGVLTPANAFYRTNNFGVTATVFETCRVVISGNVPYTGSQICMSGADLERTTQATIKVTGSNGDVVLTVEF
jgi:hypothetical protein